MSIHQYDDIIDLSRPEPKNHPRMSMQERAAQFMPFAALTGYSSVIAEAARPTDTRIHLTDHEKENIDRRLMKLQRNVKLHPEVQITYFVPDGRKKGGSYQTVRGAVSKIDPISQRLFFTDGLAIEFKNLLRIEISRQ